MREEKTPLQAATPSFLRRGRPQPDRQLVGLGRERRLVGNGEAIVAARARGILLRGG